MSTFEYVMVMVSIIIGLAIATLLQGAVDALRVETKTKPGLLHGLWVTAILMQTVSLWSIRWTGATRAEWSYGVLLAFLFMPIVYYALAALLFPSPGEEIKLSEYFLRNRQAFFGLLILSALAGAFGPLVFYEGQRPAGTEFWGQLGWIPVLGYLAWSRNERLHTVFAALWLLGLLALALFGGLTMG